LACRHELPRCATEWRRIESVEICGKSRDHRGRWKCSRTADNTIPARYVSVSALDLPDARWSTGKSVRQAGVNSGEP
jgi:hypothetical protein